MPTVTYEAALMFWRIITQIFFREIRPRGAFHIPRDGPVIFVGAPHHNQVCLWMASVVAHVDHLHSSLILCS